MRRHLLSLATLLALLVLQAPSFGQWIAFEASVEAAPAVQSREFRKTVELGAGGNLTLKTDKGSVRLTAWDRNQVDIFARIEPPNDVRADYARRAVEGAQIEVYGDARSLTVRSDFDGVPYKDGFINRSRSLPNIHYEIRAPRSLNLNLEVDRSKVEVSGFEGRARINTDRTPFTASNLAGDMRLNMDRGRATLTGFKGSLDIEVDRTDVELQSVEIEGDSRFEIDRGDLELRLAGAQGLSLRADISRRGDFHSDFGVTMQSIRGKNFEGEINGGGPKLSIHADRAKVRLKRNQ